MRHPDRVTAIVSQNGNAYKEGLSDAWDPIRRYWAEPTTKNREVVRDALLTLEGTRWQYTHGVANPEMIAPESYTLDAALLERPGNKDISSISFSITLRTSPSIQSFKNISAKQASFARHLGQASSVFYPCRSGGLPAG